jgi:hypothetical protein
VWSLEIHLEVWVWLRGKYAFVVTVGDSEKLMLIAERKPNGIPG